MKYKRENDPRDRRVERDRENDYPWVKEKPRTDLACAASGRADFADTLTADFETLWTATLCYSSCYQSYSMQTVFSLCSLQAKRRMVRTGAPVVRPLGLVSLPG